MELRWGYFVYDRDSVIMVTQKFNYSTEGEAQHDLNTYWQEQVCEIPASYDCQVFCYNPRTYQGVNHGI